MQMKQALSSPASLTSSDYSRLAYSKDGAYYTNENGLSNGAAAILYSGISSIDKEHQEKIAKVLTQQTLMADIKNTQPLAASIYFNSFDSLKITYPYTDVLSKYGPSTNATSNKFYYEADATHNPEKKVKWTNAYLDKDNNLITSAICPVYNADFLEGVVGVDININSITNQILAPDIPWDGYNLLIGNDGTVLSLPDKNKNDWEFDGSIKNSSNQIASKDDLSSNPLNVYKTTNLSSLANKPTGLSNFMLNGESKIISWSTIPSTGWKVLVVIPEKNLYSKINSLEYTLTKISIIIISGLILSYFIFFYILYSRLKNTHFTISNSFLEINNIVQKISYGEYNVTTPTLNIKELNDISSHLIKMGQSLGETTSNLLLTQSELRKKETDLKSLVNSINDIIFEIDSNGSITTLWSSTNFDLYKLYTQGHFNSIYDLLDVYTSKIAKQKINYVIKTREAASIDFNIESDSGIKWFEASMSPRLNDINTVVISARDITEQKKMARSIIAAKEEAEKASSAKSEFLSSMSHELRTPLNAILGFSQVLELDPESPLNDSQSQSVKEITKAGNHLLELINEVLDLAKIESGKLSISIESVQIKPLMEETLAIIKPFADQHNIKILNYPIDESNEFVSADHTRLKQILLNLLSNAIKYNKKNGEVIFYHDKSNDKYRFHVIDTGIGLSNSDLDLIFKPFQRLYKVNNTIEGTGIGLAVAKQLVELMSGEIFVVSEKDVGSHFWVEFPYVESESLEVLDSTSQLENHLSFSEDKSYKVLYAEDNPANLRLVERILSQINNIKMLSANTGELCIDLAIAHKPDIILLDINLPGIDGYEVFQRLKMHKETTNIPIIAISAHAMPRDLDKALSLGFTDYITKPINIPSFVEKISHILIDL